MTAWRNRLRYDPVSPLLAFDDEALRYFVRRDLTGEGAGGLRRIWRLPQVKKLLAKQTADGSFAVPASKKKHPAQDYPLIETWRQFRYLVEVFGCTRKHPPTEKAAEFIFSRRTADGDFRGFIASQYATYYTGAILSLLIQAGYAGDRRVEQGMRWLLSMRQDDGGWTVPIQTHYFNGKEMYRLTGSRADPVEPDRSQPFAHNATGMVVRAFAVHPRYRNSREARIAAGLLADRLFQEDRYSSYQAASHWVRFQYPFWWNNLVAALDSISRIGLPASDPRITRALEWLAGHQEKDGLWRDTYAAPRRRSAETAKIRATRCWVTLAICRIFRRYFG